MTDYSHHSHVHCYEQENPPCGLGNSSRGTHCCLCDICHPQKPQKEPISEVQEGFVKSGARQNLIDLVEKYPAQKVNAIDAAYVAGYDDAEKHIEERLQSREKEVLEWVLAVMAHDTCEKNDENTKIILNRLSPRTNE